MCNIIYLIRSQMFHNTRQIGVSTNSDCYIRDRLRKARLIHHNCITKKMKAEKENEKMKNIHIIIVLRVVVVVVVTAFLA